MVRETGSNVNVSGASASPLLIAGGRRDELTPLGEVGTLSFWEVVKLDMQSFTLTIEGEADRPVVLRYDELLELPAVERTVPMNCVGGSREDAVVKGVTVAHLFALARVRDTARLAVFSCADGHEESIPLIELIQQEALLVYSVNGVHVDKLGYPLRLCIPGKYACHWAKGVERIELVADQRKGCSESQRRSHRANAGDI